MLQYRSQLAKTLISKISAVKKLRLFFFLIYLSSMKIYIHLLRIKEEEKHMKGYFKALALIFDVCLLNLFFSTVIKWSIYSAYIQCART